MSEQNKVELPELPRPSVTYADHSYPAFSKLQMAEYARASILANSYSKSPVPIPEQVAPTAWLATDLDGRGDVAFTKEEAKRRAGEGCTEFFPLYDFAPTTSTVSASGALAAAEDSSRADEDWFFHPNDD